LLFVKIPLQPPLADAVDNHALKALFTCACVKQDAVKVSTGQESEICAVTVVVNKKKAKNVMLRVKAFTIKFLL